MYMKNSVKTTSLAENSTGFKGLGDNDSMLKTNNQLDNLKVVLRVRPALPREMEIDLPFRSVVLVSNDNKSCNLVEYLGAELYERERQREWMENPGLFQLHRFTFDYVFDMDSSQQEVYETTAKPAVISILQGYNSTIFAYGQTGTGKTFTMEGFTYNSSDVQRGIIPRSIEEIFNYIESFSSHETKFMVRASYLQIYNESISDLLKPEKTSLQIREDKKRGVFVEGLSEWAVRSPSDIYTLLQRGASSRATASTKMNDVSSRSHAVFVVTVEQMTIVDDGRGEALTQIKVGKLNMVDLAGSERIRVTGATGKQLEESKKINKSLSALGNVIYALTDNKGRTHIPYRDSKLTRLLEDSLGGNCKTTMMAMISPAHDSFSESLSTLHFAKRAKNIKNRPMINEDVDHRALIRQYEVELKRLRTELEEKNRLIHNNEAIIQLEEEKKRAEEDKQAAIFAFEQASKQYLQEREEKKKLEIKISMMASQLLVGGQKIEDTPQFRSALEERQSILLKEFDLKLQEFEKERQQIEEDKAQVERYKQLLLKQRDIMIALTNKLNERDEAIVQLQEELDAYDKINREQEDLVENKNQRIFVLENILKRNNLAIPNENINPNEKEKYNRGKLDKIHIPYEIEKNGKDFENAPMTLLSSDEKIRELRGIIKEQEKEINILKILSQKFINHSNNNMDKPIDVIKNAENEYNINNKIAEVEEEKNYLIKELEKKNELLNLQKQENENITDQYTDLEKSNEKLESDLSRMLNLKGHVIKNLDDLIKRIDSENNHRNIRKDLTNILQFILENTKNNNSSGKSSNSNIYEEKNFSQDDDKERRNYSNTKTNNNSNTNRSSYVTQTYEKFKQTQEALKKNNENKLINQVYYNFPNNNINNTSNNSQNVANYNYRTPNENKTGQTVKSDSKSLTPNRVVSKQGKNDFTEGISSNNERNGDKLNSNLNNNITTHKQPANSVQVNDHSGNTHTNATSNISPNLTLQANKFVNTGSVNANSTQQQKFKSENFINKFINK